MLMAIRVESMEILGRNRQSFLRFLFHLTIQRCLTRRFIPIRRTHGLGAERAIPLMIL